jgi:hypothetical protein
MFRSPDILSHDASSGQRAEVGGHLKDLLPTPPLTSHPLSRSTAVRSVSVPVISGSIASQLLE